MGILKRLDVEHSQKIVSPENHLASPKNDSQSTNASKKRKRDGSQSTFSSDRREPLLSSTQKIFNSSIEQARARPSIGSESEHNAHVSTHDHVGSTGHKSKTQQVQSQAEGSSSISKHDSLKDRANSLWLVRKTLPIWSHSLEIRNSLREKDVLLLVGETGSGKSTQVPQMLLREPWCKPQTRRMPTKFGTQDVTVGGCIAVTEPRRVAAISLARRVAEEMGSPLGSSSPASQVGYSVRFDTNTSPSTRIKFLTEGMLLQEFLRDPFLRAYSAVVVDEVHERGVNVDLVLGFLKRLVSRPGHERGGVRLKVCVMSATAEMDKLKGFFEDSPTIDGLEVSNQGEDGIIGKEPSVKSTETNGKKSSGVSEGHLSGTNGEIDEKTGMEESEWSGISTSDDGGDVGDVHQEQKAKGKEDSPGVNNTSEKQLPDRSKSEAGASSQENASQSIPSGQHNEQDVSRLATCYIQGRQFPVKINYVPQPVQDIVEASLKTIFQIHYKEPMPGDILVFLTGKETVESLESLVKEYALGMGPEVPKLLVLPLFAALPQAAQQRVFQPPPPKTRKVVISTNIAETSVTVSGVRFLIDCGKAKIKHFRSAVGIESLLVKPISKSAAIQRKGRAGREAPGQCFRLYTERDYLALQESNTPEILRCDLSHPILTMKARGVDDVLNFSFLDHPPREAMEKALLHLWMLSALTDSGEISAVGLRIAKFPLSVSLGRTLIAATEPTANCVEEVIDIISCLSVENVFLNLHSEERKEQAETARRELYKRDGDHLTLLATVRAYSAEDSDRKTWADKHFVSHRAMRAVMDVRKQLRAQCLQMGMLSKAASSDADGMTTTTSSSSLPSSSSEKAIAILRCFLKGFTMNTAMLCPDGSYKTCVGRQVVAIHPSSVLFGRKCEAIVFNEFVFTKKSYARGCSAVQLDWIAEQLPRE